MGASARMVTDVGSLSGQVIFFEKAEEFLQDRTSGA